MTGNAAPILLGILCALTALSIPIVVAARNARRTDGDALDEQTSADWGVEIPHNDGCNAA